MNVTHFLLAGALGAIAFPAAASVTIIGNSPARSCYEAAEHDKSAAAMSIAHCDEALAQRDLGHYDTVATYVNRGILKMRMDMLGEALSDFDQAIARDPDQPEAYLNKAVALLRRDDWRAALPVFDEAIAKRTQRPALAYFGRAIAHEMAGRVKQAYLDYRQASVLEPKWRDPQVELARFSVRQ